jgi:hypothetical protein
MKRLFLDDHRVPPDCAQYMYSRGVNCTVYHEEWVIVRSYGQFIKWIEENGLPDLIAFDHDLADVPELKETLPLEEWFDLENSREYTGMDCARWLANYCSQKGLKLPEYSVHSMNPQGYLDIKDYLKNVKKHLNL